MGFKEFGKDEKHFTNMKQHGFAVRMILMILIFPAICFGQHCEDSSFNLGKIDDHWLYKNENLKISFQLPEGWYLFDQLASEKKYVKIGSDYRKLSEPMVDNGPGPIIALSQIKSYPLDYALTLFSIAKLSDSALLIPAANELQQNNTISCKAYYAEIKETDELLKVLFRKFTGNSDAPEIKEGRLGEIEYKYISLTVTNKTGITEKRIFGARNFGCVNIIIRINYITDADLSGINDACRELKIVQ